MKGLIFKRYLGLISGIYDRRRNERWQKMPYIEGIRSPLFDIPVECTKWLRGHTYARDSSRVSCQWVPQVLHRLQNKEKPIRTTFTLRFGSLKMIFECSIARCDVGLGRAIVQCQKNPLRKPKLSINRAILSAHFSAVKFCIGFFCWIGFFLVLHRLFL